MSSLEYLIEHGINGSSEKTVAVQYLSELKRLCQEKDALLKSQGERIQIQSELLSRRAEGTKITEHEGKKYLREIFGATDEIRFVEVAGRKIPAIKVDVYCVLSAFAVDSAPVAHAVKKCLAAGKRGKSDVLADLKGVLAAISRAVEQHQLEALDGLAGNAEAKPE